MSSWVQLLLLALLAACARFGVAEEDALPAALVELVRNSPIASIEDLQLLLLSDSVDEEESNSAANGGHRLPRSLDAQPAVQAQCKVRTEVVEVTRAMLDRSNANFLLWPPCVEVQRCSGCCNTKSLHCVPVLTHTRYLQVMKIEYINKRPTYAKAVVSVVDHVECRCQTAPRTVVLKKKSSHRPHSHLHRNQTLSPGPAQGQVKVHSKEELHHLDELKQNQRAHLEDLSQHWDPRGDTFPQPEGYSLTEEDTSRSEEAVLISSHWAYNFTKLLGTEHHTEAQENGERKNVEVSKDKSEPFVGIVGMEAKLGEDGFNSTERNPKMGHKDTQTHKAMFNNSEESLNERVRNRFRPTKEPNPDPRELAGRRENETPDMERMLQVQEEKLEAERKELLLLHKRLDEEKELLRQQQIKREEEEKVKDKEVDSQHFQHRKHHHLHTTTPKPETTSPTTQKPSPTKDLQLPIRRNSPKRRRLRKNRKKISKAAMRAMLM
ncbi:PREDICTED: trichohyalin-like [Cyprinodon variegatus]|uniref:Platelet-derived growth factor subunit B n=1 Tax=Cyprinodon variegatus TaxID=28743 RepID=A0A3Q2CBK0_CYPVA|nr:PREDICTED: trichohyalin-like [Cyprinodon variegatus]